MKRLPLLLLAVGCWTFVGASFRETWDKRSTEDEQPPGRSPPYEGQRTWPGKRSAEEEDCLVDCKKDYPKLSVQACLQKCKITKRSTEEVSAQDPPPQPWQVNGPGKRSADATCWTNCRARGDSDEECVEDCGPSGEYKRSAGKFTFPPSKEDRRIMNERHNCTVNCLRNHPRNYETFHFCGNYCNNVTKRSVSAQDPPPQPWQVNGPGKRAAEEGCTRDCQGEGNSWAWCFMHCTGPVKRSADGNCITNCRAGGDSEEDCLTQCGPSGEYDVEKRSVSAQDPPPQPWQVNGPGKRAAEQYRPWSGNYSEILHMEERVAHESQNCTLECYRRTNFSRSACQHICNDRTKRSVSAQDPPPQPWQVNGPGKRSAEESSCWSDCVARGGHSGNCAQACQGCHAPYCGYGKRSVEESSCWGDCVAEGRESGNCAQACQGCFAPQCTWRGHGKRSAEEEDCLVDCKKDHPKLSVQACLQKCQIGKRSIGL